MAEITINGAVHNVAPGSYQAQTVLLAADGVTVITASPTAPFEVPGEGAPPVADAPNVGVSGVS